MIFISYSLKNQKHCCLFPFLQGMGWILLIATSPAKGREYTFAASALDGDVLQQQNIDLSLFSKSDAQLPGTYPSRIIINGVDLGEEDISYRQRSTGELVPDLTPDMLRKWGVFVDKYTGFAVLDAKNALPAPLDTYIPHAIAKLDFSVMTLRLSIPQAAMSSMGKGYIDPSRWDDGIPVAFADYAISGSQNKDSEEYTTANQYLNMRSGVNLGGWRLRSYSTWTKTEDSSQWSTINTYIQHDLDTLRAQLTGGESSTRGEVFDSLQYQGVNLASDEEMLPFSQRGFAPVIRGIANSNAEISVRQNGYLIYQQTVAPGAFEISDLNSTTNSGDLDVTIKEADGSERHFTQPFSSTAVMQRPGNLRYEFTAGRYRSDSGNDQNEPAFVQSSFIYGLNNTSTVYGGIIGSKNYRALNGGAGIALGQLGAISADITQARTRLDDRNESSGQSYRLLYSGKIDTTNTNFTLSSYRYSTRGYFSFADANQRYDESENDLQFDFNKRNRLQLSMSQSISGVSLYINGYQQDYWGTSQKERSISAGLNTVINGISSHLAYTYTKTNAERGDQSLSFGLSMPLSLWLPHAWSSYSVSTSKHGYTRHNLGLNGTLLDDQRLSYSLQQSRSNHDADDTSSLYGSYRSQYGNLNAGYYYSSDRSQRLSYGMNGAVVAHPHGVTLAQPLGNQFAIVNASGAPGVRFQNQRGIQTDWQGNAIVPSLSPYQENHIRIDTTSLPDNVDTAETAITVIPSRNAAVIASFDAHIGYRALITLTRANGQVVPFGAIATVNPSSASGIVDDTGTLYLAGVTDQFQINAKWGNDRHQQCTASIKLDMTQQTAIHTAKATCQQEQQHVD